MTQKDAKRQLLALWANWTDRSEPSTNPQKLKFYDFLEKHHSEILDFRTQGEAK